MKKDKQNKPRKVSRWKIKGGEITVVGPMDKGTKQILEAIADVFGDVKGFHIPPKKIYEE